MPPPNPQAAPSPLPPVAARRPALFAQLNRFWQRVTEGLEISQLWKQFSADARASYRLYHRDVQARPPQGAHKQGFWHTAQEYAWAILEKLTPARRVLLLIAVLLVLFGGGEYTHQNKAGDVTVITLPLQFYGGALLFILLMLEVADRVVMKRDLEIARDIQRWLLPATPPQVRDLNIAFTTRAANTVAGD
jgi:sigma-B regulation protein RsbU (phosphoserine phosphatase)